MKKLTGLLYRALFTLILTAVCACSGGGGSQSQTGNANTPNPSVNIPSQPTGLRTFDVTSKSVELIWNYPSPSEAATINGYKIIRNNVVIAQLNGIYSTYSDKTITPGTDYSYEVCACGNFGETKSDPLAVHVGIAPIAFKGYALQQVNYVDPSGAARAVFAGVDEQGLRVFEVDTQLRTVGAKLIHPFSETGLQPKALFISNGYVTVLANKETDSSCNIYGAKIRLSDFAVISSRIYLANYLIDLAYQRPGENTAAITYYSPVSGVYFNAVLRLDDGVITAAIRTDYFNIGQMFLVVTKDQVIAGGFTMWTARKPVETTIMVMDRNLTPSSVKLLVYNPDPTRTTAGDNMTSFLLSPDEKSILFSDLIGLQDANRTTVDQLIKFDIATQTFQKVRDWGDPDNPMAGLNDMVSDSAGNIYGTYDSYTHQLQKYSPDAKQRIWTSSNFHPTDYVTVTLWEKARLVFVLFAGDLSEKTMLTYNMDTGELLN